MAEIRRLQPHDPVPDSGAYVLVMRRFGEDAARLAIVELIESDGQNPPRLSIPAHRDGTPMDFEEAVQAAVAEADRQGLPVLYAVDRTAGPREREVLAHGGDRTVGMDRLSDTDLEEGEEGTDIRDRPRDAGYNLTPER